MALMNVLKRFFVGGPAHSPVFMEFMNTQAKALGYPITWDDEEVNWCTFDMTIDDRAYLLWIKLIDGTVSCTMFCKNTIDVLSQSMRDKLVSRNENLQGGMWMASGQRIGFAAQIPADECQTERLRDAIGLVVSKVSMLDRKYFGAAQRV
jgi:hypothetical protein